MLIMSIYGNGSLCEPGDTSLNVGRSNWRLRVVLVSMFIFSLFYQVNLILTTFGYVLFTNYRILGPCMSFKYYSSTPDCPEVDLTWTGLFPCDLGWRGSALTVVILSTLLLICYYLITTCLLKWNTPKKLTVYFRKVSVVECRDRYAEFEERVKSTNTQMLCPTLSLCLILMAFHLLLQSGDIESNPGPKYSRLTVEDLKKETGVTDKQLSQRCSKEHLGQCSLSVSNYHKFATRFCLPEGVLAGIRVDQNLEYPQKTEAVFLWWRKNVGNATYLRFVQACLHPSVNEGDIAREMCKLCMCSAELETSHTHIQPTEESIDVYRSYLTSIYDTDYLPVDDKYPLSCTKRFINLECADIRKHCTREELEELWSDIVRGKLDEIPCDKIPIQQIALKQNDKFPKLVLIRGAPGVGKTTLSWELCRQWAKGKFWTEYSLVVLLRLRDESSQTATEVVDLLQCENSDISRSVNSTIRKKQGHGVLFLLEGLDELPETLRKDSIFLKLITGRLLPASTVLVTTRPWAVEYLPYVCHQRIDQLIEILGFSSEQIRDYIDMMIKDGAPAELYQYIDSNPRIASSMCNPLHARIIVEAYRENYKNTKSVFPNTITEIYVAYSNVLIKRHLQDNNPGVNWSEDLTDLPSSIQPHFDKLCYIAYEGITSENQQLVFFKEDIQDTSSTLGFMNSVHPLHRSIMTKNSSPSYNFLHLTLQEFLAAFYISKKMTPREQLILFEVNDGVYKMILLFLAGLTGLHDSLVGCIHSNPFAKEKRIFGDNVCNFANNEICWLYESQNAKALLIRHKGMQYDSRYLPRDNHSLLFALGYIIVSADLSLTQLDFESNCQNMSMLLAGMSRACSDFTIHVRNLHIYTGSSQLFSLFTNNSIQPKIEQFSFKQQKDSIHTAFVHPEKWSLGNDIALKVYKLLIKSPDLRIVELDFGACRENIQQILDILKSKCYLKTLKCSLASADDEKLLSTFVKHSFIKKLVLIFKLIDTSNPVEISSHSRPRTHSHISVELDVDKLKANNPQILPQSLCEFPFPVETELGLPNYFVKESTMKKLVLFINHWEASLKSLTYYLDPCDIQLYHPISMDLYRAVLNCPLLEKLNIGTIAELTVMNREFVFFETIFDFSEIANQFRTHQNLTSLTLHCLGNVSDVLNSLKGNHILKSLKLECNFDLLFDTTIGEYIENSNNSLVELHLDCLNWMGWSRNLMQGLQHNTNLKILKIFTYWHNRTVGEEETILIAEMLRFNDNLRFLKLPIYSRFCHELSPILEALSTNTSLKHVELDIKSPDDTDVPVYTLTAKETKALSNVLTRNSTLEVFYLNMVIIDCQSIIEGLSNSKTLKKFGTAFETKKNIRINYPDYISVGNKIEVINFSQAKMCFNPGTFFEKIVSHRHQ